MISAAEGTGDTLAAVTSIVDSTIDSALISVVVLMIEDDGHWWINLNDVPLITVHTAT